MIWARGTCNCGAVSFAISGPLPGMYQCHCTLCRKQSGTGSNAATIVRHETFTWISGQDTIRRWKKTSGFNSHFCTNCGSPAPNAVGVNYMWIPVGLIENLNSTIAAHLWHSSKASWNQGVADARQYECMPDDLEAFIEFLHGG